MATVQLNATAYGYVDEANPNTHYSVTLSSMYRIGDITHSSRDKQFLIQFGAFPSSLKRKNLTGIKINMHLKGVAESYRADTLYWYVLNGSFNPNTVTWNNKPKDLYGAGGRSFYGIVNEADYFVPQNSERYDLAQGIAHGNSIRIRMTGSWTNENRELMDIRALLSNNANTYAVITYDDTNVTSQIEYRSGPQSGYSNPRNSISFSWAYQKANNSLHSADENFTQSSAVLYWKKSTDSNYTAIQVSGSSLSVTVPANTFPTASTIQWYVKGTDTDGTTTQTTVYSFSTAAGTAYAYPQSPINTVEDGSSNITFQWSLGSSDGQTPTAVDLWWKLPSESQSSWHTLIDHGSAVTSFVTRANLFPAGEIQWLLRAYNVDDVAGPWARPSSSTYYSFICVAAPQPVQGLSATSVPRPTISWQSSEQKAYEISIDGVVVKKAFSESVNSWVVQEPLDDGDHVISVRVQGQYGLWSRPSTVTISVQNMTTNTLTLSGVFGIDASLTLIRNNGESNFTVMHIYRDGVRIAQKRTSEQVTFMNFVDRSVLGTHSYYAELWFSDGNYVRSNTITGTMKVDYAMIALADGGEWIDIGISEMSASHETFSANTNPAYYHVLGAEYPQAELSMFKEFTGNYNCAFKDHVTAAQFESMFGKAVILKSRWNNVVTGILTPVQKKATLFYVSYVFAVQQIHTEKLVYINETT